MSIHAAPMHPGTPEAPHRARIPTAVATALLAAASTLALGSAGVEVAVLAIAVLTPIVLLGTLVLVRG
jgi:hypothetical protein